MPARILGYIIAHDYSAFYDLYFAEIHAQYTLILGAKLNPTRHFRTYDDADRYAQNYFRHLKSTNQWAYIGNLTRLETFPTNHWHRDYGHRRRYKPGVYYTISHKKRGTPKKYRYTNKYISRIKC